MNPILFLQFGLCNFQNILMRHVVLKQSVRSYTIDLFAVETIYVTNI